MKVQFALVLFVFIFKALASPVIIIIEGDSVIESDTVGDFEAAIGSSFYVREQSSIRIVANFIINTTDAVEPRTVWYYHSSVDGIRTEIEDRLVFLPDGTIGRMITNAPWSGNDSYSIILRAGLRSEILNIPSLFPVHEGFFTFEVNVDNIPSQEATTEIRITFPPTTAPTTPPPTQPPVECSRPLDVYFAIDGSGSLGLDVFTNEINFVIDTIQSFASPMNRYGYLIFASEIQANIELNMNSSAVKESLLAANYNGGGTEFLPALDLIFDTYFTPDNIREGASRVLFFISDGSSEGNFTMIIEKARMLSELSQVEIVTVGFGNPNLNQLSLIATNNNNFSFTTIDEARDAVNMLVAVACPTLPSCCQGPIGFRGERGIPGYRGDPGMNGKNGICETLEECLLTGLRGREGMKGSPGMKGAPGSAGIKGESGAKGMTGDQGSVGQKGAKGETGLRGDPGAKGSEGSTGASGPKGATGVEGPEGEQGPQGTKGAKGDTGPPGVCDFPECVGQKGWTGPKGVNGSKGFPGSRGEKGAKGSQGIKGDVGLKGSNGLLGAQGETGESGGAIEMRVYSEDSRNCTTDGSLLYDPESDRIYYCSMGQYLCVGKEDCS